MDSTTDNSFRTLWGMMKVAGTPDYLRDGTVVDEKDAEALADTAFADRAHRRFPITDRANTWVSAGYFAKTADEHGYSPAEREAVLFNIKRAADIYGIGKDVEEMMKKVAGAPEQVKQASEDKANYCDPDHMGYPVFDKEGAEMANEFFAKHAYKYGHGRRMTIAKNIMRKSAEYGVKVAEQVRLSAGAGFPNREVMAENLFFRANELMNRGVYKMAEELCKFAKEICICSDEDLDKNREGLFNAIGGIDEVSGLDEGYGTRFLAPEEMVFDITPESMKEVIDDAVPIGRETLSAKALAELPKALFEKVLPKETVDGMMEGGKISPKKLSITIISLKDPETSHLLKTIKGFTDGTVDVDEGAGESAPTTTPGKDGVEIEIKGGKKDEEKSDDKED